MQSERWQRIKEVLEGALDRAPQERAGYLSTACTDPDMRREVESLISSYEAGGDMLEPPAPPPMVGRRIGPYRVMAEIGGGGMGTVYRAQREDTDPPEQVAIKLIRRGMDDPSILRRFRHERQVLAALDHPIVARLCDAGTTEEGVPYFVMEYIEGLAIDEYCDQQRLSTAERLILFRIVCAAVQYAHDKLIIHRDIKPGNILVTRDGVPKLLDFGIAKILNPEISTQAVDPTATIMRLMTPEYASPEQVRGEPVSVATDIYSLGVLLYELLTGHRPYRLKSHAPHDLARAICETEPDRPSTAVGRHEAITRTRDHSRMVITPEAVSTARRTRPDRLRRALAGDLDNIVLMALRKQPARRYASVEQFSEDIRRYLEGRPVAARQDTVTYRTAKFFSRHRVACIAVGTPVLAGLLMAGYLSWRPAAALGPSALPRVVPLTSLPGNETQPAFSPDGKRVAFVWGGEQDDNPDVYAAQLSGGPLVRLTTNRAEDVSPVWSPDGQRLVFLRSSEKETAVFVAPMAGGVHGKITDVYRNRIEAVGRHVDWSPDGRYLAVADRTTAEEPFSIYLVDAATGRKARLTDPPSRGIGDTSPAFSPDGTQLSFLRAPSSGITELWVMPLPSGEPRRLTFDGRVILSQTWAPDSASLVFSSNRIGGFYLWRIAPTGGAPQRVAGIGENATEPSFSRDGRYLAYSQFFQDANIWRIDLDGSRADAPRRLVSSTYYDSSPQISPDGSRIAFRSNRSGTHEIWISDIDGRNAWQLTHFEGPLTGTPRWSPDGRWIAFDSRPEGQADIFIIPSEGGVPRRLTFETAEDVVPSWSRDGKWVYFASNRSGSWQVWKVPPEGGGKVQVTRNGGFASFESPDGEYLYYAKGRGVAGLWRVPLGGGEETLVLDRLKPGYWGYWAVTREGILFVDTPESSKLANLYLFDPRKGAVRLLVPIDKPLALADSSFGVSADGRTVLYTQVDQSGSDIMLADWR